MPIAYTLMASAMAGCERPENFGSNEGEKDVRRTVVFRTLLGHQGSGRHISHHLQDGG
jgi:hypothetical protein